MIIYKTIPRNLQSNAIIFDGTLYHNTDLETAKLILKNGFKVEDTSTLSSDERGFITGNLGDGVYLSPRYAENMNLWGGESNLLVKPIRPLILYDLKDLAKITFEKSDSLKKQGFDGIIVNDPHPHSGGYQVVIFNAKNIKAKKIVEYSDVSPELLNKEDVHIKPFVVNLKQIPDKDLLPYHNSPQELKRHFKRKTYVSKRLYKKIKPGLSSL